MTRTVHVAAPCRLHFGMFAFGRSSEPQWGGVGVMVEPPTIQVFVREAASFSVDGMLAGRAEQFARSAARHWQLSAMPRCRIQIQSPSEHRGLGVGTQLGLSVAAGLRKFLGLSDLSPEDLASSVRRGARSAVGTLGFHGGGLIVDAGKNEGQPLGTLFERAPLPPDWRFVLISQPDRPGLSGDTESDAFAQLPPVPAEVTQELWRLTKEEMLPAVRRQDVAAFGEAVYHFGRFAGECFSRAQGGPFATEEIGRRVDAIRDHGISGVGQSSWGPTIFAVTANDAEAEALSGWLREKLRIPNDQILIACPNNAGATIS